MFDAWQAQQKAQKDQERKAKTEAAAALQGYRRTGLSEEETKLAALKEQERLQKLNAEQQLRGYRSQLSEEEAKLAAQRQEELRKKQELEEQLRNNGVVSPGGRDNNRLVENSGVVSARAAELSSPKNLQSPKPKGTKPSPAQSAAAPPPPPPIAGASPGGKLQELLDTPENTTKKVFLLSTKSNPPPAPSGAPPPPSRSPKTRSPKGRSPKTRSTKAPSPRSAKSPKSPKAPKAPKTYSSSVKFMFGILTSGETDVSFPEERRLLIEGYLARADQIAKQVLADDKSSSSSFESIALSLAYPTAGSVKKDNTRKDTNRIMVTVTISYVAPDRATSTDFKTQVINRVRSAISAGTFTKLER